MSMIQTADVGIGIAGQEGMQAVMASDFSMSRFKFLRKFLLVHGHWSYDRLARMVLYFFYKNATFVFLIFWYQLSCGFSGTIMIDQMYHMLYNLFFTSLPPIAIGNSIHQYSNFRNNATGTLFIVYRFLFHFQLFIQTKREIQERLLFWNK